MMIGMIIAMIGMIIDRNMIMKWIIMLEVYSLAIGVIMMYSLSDILNVGIVIVIMIIGTLEVVIGIIMIISG